MCKGQWPITNRLLTITLLAIMFFICRAFAFRTQCINPTNALALGIVLTIQSNNYQYWNNIWIFIVAPLIGSALAAFTLDHIYLPLLEAKQ
jgi:glycerol uptake facilitator-like aquaporin